MKKKRIVSMLLALATVFGQFAAPNAAPKAMAAEADSGAATLTVDMANSANTGDILHGAGGFLYGVSSEDVPTTNTLVPLKTKILATKGAVGTEHPYGDTLDVAKTFLESGGQQVMMYNSNYYGVFGVSATTEEYCSDLENYICPAVVEWKEAWKAEHGTPDDPKDDLGATIDIDEAICYIPINEGTPAYPNFYDAWEAYYTTIKAADPGATMVGPNDAGYWADHMDTFIQRAADDNCMPDIISWHELDTPDLKDMSAHMDHFENIWNTTDWTAYNEANGLEAGTIPEIPQICITEYAEMGYCGVPGRLVNWIGRFEDEKITGCLPFWHQANNLNDLTAGANEGNGAWWLYQWYGNMSGTTQPVTSSTAYDLLYGVSTMDEAKKLSTTLFGGYNGDIVVELNNVDDTTTFANADWVSVTVEETMFSGFHGVANETPTVVQGIYPVAEDGTVEVTVPDAQFESAYKLTVSQVDESQLDAAGMVLFTSSGTVYEAEDAQLSGGARVDSANTNPLYYMSGIGDGLYITDKTFLPAVVMPNGGQMTYTINVPTDGLYRFDFVYGNGQGTNRNDMYTHDPINIHQTFQLDDKAAETVTMESTLFQTMTGYKTMYFDLTAGTHTMTVTTADANVTDGMVYHDFLRVSYAGVYGEEAPAFNKVYEAELADFNNLLNGAGSTVTTETTLSGFSGNGYVEGLNARPVTEGGGIRYTVVVEDSGLYNLTLRYQSETAGSANIYVGNTATTLNRLNKTVDLAAAEGWQTVTATIYLQKGINIVDVDTTVAAAVDYLRVRELDAQTNSTTIEAEDAIPASLADKIEVATSEGASGGQYVVGMAGAYEDANYLEFTYNAPSAGTYQMQVFHSNEDLAGSHGYNIKAIDKYAVFDVNGTSNYPLFHVVGQNEAADIMDTTANIVYFVDCGDHDPATLSEGDRLGDHNSVTDQHYGPDAGTGYNWGVVPIADNDNPYTPVGSNGVYTEFQRPNSNSAGDMVDGKPKEDSFRYANGQDGAGITPRKIAYKFEVEPGEYVVTVAMSNTWSNAATPTVTVSADGVDSVSQDYNITTDNEIHFMTIDVTNATVNDNGLVELSVEATSNDPTIQMNYIVITEPQTYYFVDCGDQKRDTVSEGDSFGVLNSVTDQVYSEDAKSGYSWGVVLEDGREAVTSGYTDGVDNYGNFDTTYQKSSAPDGNDGYAKTETSRYAAGQDGAGITTRYISYQFELDPGEYDVTVCMRDVWRNSTNPTLTLSADGVEPVVQEYTIEELGNTTHTMTIDLSRAAVNADGKVELSVKATSDDPTIHVCYIQIDSADVTTVLDEEALPENLVLLPQNVLAEKPTADLSDDMYIGQLTADDPWMIDYRNLTNSTDRYFFINTFSDDTFREKTITLNLQKGENTIRVYNDNSWNVTFGGTNRLPATEWVPNYTPNFDKFIITPMALDTAVEQAESYNITMSVGSGGSAVSNCNAVAANGEYTLTLTPDGSNQVTVIVNGVDRTADLTETDTGYTLTVTGVNEDQDVVIFFAIDRSSLQTLVDKFDALDPDAYTVNSWAAVAAIAADARDVLENASASDSQINEAYGALNNALNTMLVERNVNMVYFVDCGDHDPATITGNNDSFGTYNSVTDQHYGADAVTGYNWGVVPLDDKDKVLTSEEGCKTEWNESDKGVYTTYQRPLSNNVADLNDGQDKTATFRYANDQDGAGYSTRTVQYQFELEPGQYEVTVGMSNTWGNANNPTVTLSADGVNSVAQAYNVGAQNTHTMAIDLTDATANSEGTVDLSVVATSNDPTIQMTYIEIVRVQSEDPEEPEEPVVPDGDHYAFAGIYSAGKNENGKAVFNFNMNQAKGVAAVEVTFVASSSDVTIEGANGFEYLNIDTVALADGSFEKTVTFSYLPNGAGGGTGVNFECDESTTIATFAVGGAAPEIRITSRVLAGYDADNNGIYVDDELVVIDPDHAVYASYDVNGDGKVDLLDIVTAQKYYQLTDGDDNWDTAASSDVNGDGVVNLEDLITILMNYSA